MAAFFEGYDSSNDYGLWVTDGSTGSTVELTSISGANAGGVFNNVRTPDFTSFDGTELFQGYDSAAHYGLWVSNGTSAGTHELTGISGVNANGIFNGIINPGFTLYNNEILFEGDDTAGRIGLWMTNGTAAGTTELTSISGANASGVQPTDLTVLTSDGVLLFSGVDAAGNTGLWASNGTASGTFELTPITHAEASGLHPFDLTVFGNMVLFEGTDSSSKQNLWVTNGTAAGTIELTGITGANTNFNGMVLFAGTDAAGNQSLWVTNGTVAGTYELDSADLLPSDMTVYDGKVLFAGLDGSGNYGLWETNGMPGGTVELTVSGANSGGIFNNGGVHENPDFTVVDGQVLFRGLGPGGTPEIWQTNGTSGGTEVISPISGANPGGINPLDYAAIPTMPRDDFTGNGTDDYLLQNASGGLVDWLALNTENGTVWNSYNLGNPNAYGYNFAGTGDFNGDGTTDILLQTAGGGLADWIMKNGTMLTGYNLGNPTAYGYSFIGTGDFNGDGTTDLLLQSASGNLIDWIMQNGTVLTGYNIGNPTLYGEKVIGTGDFTGNGTDDILLQDGSGNLSAWIMQYGVLKTGTSIGNPAAYGYSVVGTGDFYGNGTTDLLLQSGSGDLSEWIIQGGTLVSGQDLGNPSAYGYSFVGTGDFTGNGTTDIMLQNASGAIVDWIIKNGAVLAGNSIGNPASFGYKIV
jgi:ELWxxDGT repeat protein